MTVTMTTAMTIASAIAATGITMASALVLILRAGAEA